MERGPGDDRIAICLIGPTASRKTEIAVELCKRFPCEIISVDSALVYRGMDIGTAKPDAETLARAPHRLVDIRDPEDTYSAGDFVRDARDALDEIFAARRIPLLVGGTMMYFRALTRGLAQLPARNLALRRAIDAAAARQGWPALHAELASVDPAAAGRIEPTDSQRIQRALEVYRSTGRSLSDWQSAASSDGPDRATRFLRLALVPERRSVLHERIQSRLNLMIDKGFRDEVQSLMRRPGLTREAPAMRAAGYRQFWEHLAGETTLDEARYRALVATRQLAKRQLTWLRADPELVVFDPLETDVIDAMSAFLIPFFRRLG
jgi:tRNA dimethylallyltransferase